MAERQFGPYRLVRQVAVGGMAEIHLAKTRGIAGFEKFVALKMIHPNFAEDEQFIQMLIDEAKIAVQLQHVNIAQTFDLGRVGDHYYITLEYVDGCDLYKILRRGSEQDQDMPLDVCAFVAKEVTTGLDYAHRKKDMAGTPLGIVHRDVSPQNVLVSHAGEVKLVDFGIAKATMKVRQTAAGVIKGKYYYMSPEQAWGDKLDHRSDIFSAGIVLYEMMTGQMLYLEEDLHRLLDMVRRADIAPPTKLRRDVPPQLERIVMHALAKVPGERYQNAADMANDLERFLHTYSPVFTAAKLAKHLRAVMGDPIPLASTPEPEESDPVIKTLEIGDEDLLHDRAELRDENSVIFRLDGLRPGADKASANAAARPLSPRPAAQPAAMKIPAVQPVRAPTPQPVRAPTPQPARAPTPQPLPRLRPPTGAKMELPRITQRQPRSGSPTSPVPSLPSLPGPAPAAAAPAPAPRPATRPPTGKPRDPDEQTKPVDARMLAASTWAMEGEDDPDAAGEHTVISEPPGFEGSGSTTGTTELGTDDVHYEPTMIDQGWSSSATTAPTPAAGHDTDDEDAPTLAPGAHEDDDGPTQRPYVPPAHDDDEEDGPTLTRSAGVRAPQASSSATTTPRKPHGPGSDALAAHTPTPAVSELRKPRGSRRTPAGGVAQASVLQAIVGAAGSEPMPTRVSGGRGGPSDGVPPPAPPDHGSGQMRHPGNPLHPGSGPIPQPAAMQQMHPGMQHGMPQQPMGQMPQQPQMPQPMQPQMPQMPQHDPSQQQYPGHNPLPVHNLPPHMQSYGQWPQPSAPNMPLQGAQTPPGMQPQYPFQQQPYGHQQGPTFTQQMRAVVELDEIPPQYKIQQTGPRWFVLAIAAVIAVAGAAVLTYFILRRSPEPAATAVLLIDSIPPGATVTIDGEQLPHPTPVPYSKTAPGARHTVRITLAKHKPYEEAIVVPQSGGEYRVSPVLQTLTGHILVKSTPPGAEIYIKGEPKGRTPGDLSGLEIDSTTELELRHKDFGARTVPLVWPESGEINLDIDLKK